MSSDVVIRVENLGKRYRIGSRGTHADDLRHRLNRALTYPFRKLWNGAKSQEQRAESKEPGPGSTDHGSPPSSDLRPPSSDLWALQNVSFEVKQGEILGVIGRNGAGKSTLLKILSRITEPTTGRVEIHGRIGALLEVGTGFHPELTGRENVYLNGMILGMTKPEIDLQFDAIVDFAGVEKFIDTPVKRYSSGMHVRLGFGVAAHLQPEILIVDEVLAVGDAAFQKKCIGKMEDVATQGRTVLIVSHNMHVIRNLCTCAVMLDAGRMASNGLANDVVEQYIQSADCLPPEREWCEDEAPGTDTMRLLKVAVLDEESQPTSTVRIDERIGIELVYDVLRPLERGYAAFWLKDGSGIEVLSTACAPHVTSTPDEFCGRPMSRGRYRSVCWIPPNFLNATFYMVSPIVGKDVSETQVLVRDAITFEVLDTSDMRTEYQGGWLGVVRPKLPWATKRVGRWVTESAT